MCNFSFLFLRFCTPIHPFPSTFDNLTPQLAYQHEQSANASPINIFPISIPFPFTSFLQPFSHMSSKPSPFFPSSSPALLCYCKPPYANHIFRGRFNPMVYTFPEQLSPFTSSNSFIVSHLICKALDANAPIFVTFARNSNIFCKEIPQSVEKVKDFMMLCMVVNCPECLIVAWNIRHAMSIWTSWKLEYVLVDVEAVSNSMGVVARDDLACS